jgi:DNA-binding Lrp family transcriptional regulator
VSAKKKKERNDDDDFILIQKWMKRQPGRSGQCLKGNSLSVYAIIYGFTRRDAGAYKGGYSYIADWLNLSDNGARNIVKDLVKEGFLEESKIIVNGIEMNQYKAIRRQTEERNDDENHVESFPQNPTKKCTPTKNVPLQKMCETPTKNVGRPLQNLYPDKTTKKNYKKIYLSAAQGAAQDGLIVENSDLDLVREKFREQLELDTLALRYDPGELEELEDAIVDMYTCPEPYQQIGQQLQSTKAVRQMLDKLTSQHIEYIMESLSNTTQPIKNIRSYLRVTILRAPTTVEHYYKAQANAAVARASHPAGPSAENLAASMRRIQKRGDGA